MDNNRTTKQSLTPKQETFCIEYIKDGNATRAYKVAYDAENMKDLTIRARASKLLKEKKISTTVVQLKKQLRKKAIMSIEEIQEWYAEIIKENTNDMKDRLKASELLGKSMAMFTEKQELTHQGNLMVYSPQKREDN